MTKISKYIGIKKIRRISSTNHKNKQFYNIFERIPIPAFIANKNCLIEYRNIEAEKFLIKTKNENIKNLKNIFNPKEQKNLLKQLVISLKTSNSITIPLDIPVKESNTIKAKCTISPIFINNNTISRFLILLEDITYQKQIEEQLIHSQKMEIIGMFTSSIAHDFNNMLTAIIGYSDFLIESYRNKDSLYKFMMEIKKAGERAASLSKQLLRFTGKQSLKTDMVNVNDILKDMKGMIQRLIGEKILLTISIDNTPCYIKSNRSQIEQIVMNLAINSYDAMPDGGSLIIAAKSIYLDNDYAMHYPSLDPGQYVLITVSDTGIGMDENIIKHIFEPFFTTKDKNKGTGLGLSTVYRIVKQWNGDIFVTSKPNSGTTFKIFFPQVSKPPEIHNKHFNLNQSLQGNETILLVEDDKTVRGLIKHTFSSYGYKVLEASNPKEAINMIEEFDKAINLLITDIIMPDMNGNELANYIVKKYPDIKIIYISGYMHNSSNNFIKDNSSHVFLQKPLNPGEMLKKTRELLNEGKETILFKRN